MHERIRFLTIAYMVVFLALGVIIMFRMIDIGSAENAVKEQYALILQNYTCMPRTPYLVYQNHACIRNGYYYPDCPNMTKAQKLVLGGIE
jgi:hypothetical protein